MTPWKVNLDSGYPGVWARKKVEEVVAATTGETKARTSAQARATTTNGLFLTPQLWPVRYLKLGLLLAQARHDVLAFSP